jgi:hypothetical protein
VNFQQNHYIEHKDFQVTSDNLVTSITSKIENDKHLNSIAGLSSFKLLNDIC